VQPTDTECGVKIRRCYSCGCEERASFGHDYEAVVTAPTCTEEGYTTYTCSRCGDSYVDDTVAALGHDYVLTEKLDPTREDDGYEIHTCSRCGDTQKKVLPAIGNEPDAGDEGILVFVVLAFVAVAGIAIVSKAKMAR
jgi:hypothetical protein